MPARLNAGVCTLMIYKFKLIIGILLLICTCLPLGSCQKKKVVAVNSIESKAYNNSPKKHGNSLFVSEQSKPDYLIPVTLINIAEPGSWILFIAFTWPIPILLVTRRICKSPVKKRIANSFELLFSAFAAYLIYSFVFTLWYEPMIWGYVAFTLMSMYILVSLVEILNPIVRLKKIYRDRE